jgi:hypothetical protein
MTSYIPNKKNFEAIKKDIEKVSKRNSSQFGACAQENVCPVSKTRNMDQIKKLIKRK